MNLLISLNGQDIRGLNLVPLEGTISTLIAPRKYKKMTANSNGFIHGTLMNPKPTARKFEKRDMSLSFYLRSHSQEDLKRDLDNLVEMLVNGVKDNGQYTGVNTFSLPGYGICLRLVFVEVSKFNPWIPKSNAVVTIKFTEPNPNNRSLPAE